MTALSVAAAVEPRPSREEQPALKAEARRLSFRALDIEQIGHVYEGLLDHTARRATEPYLGLAGTKDQEPEIALATLEREAWGVDREAWPMPEQRSTIHAPRSTFVKFLKDETGRSEAALKKALKAEYDGQQVSRFRSACPMNGGLQTKASNPPRSTSTSGNSSGQWNVG